MEECITKEDAKRLFETKFWEKMTYREIAVFQMNTKILCMPFDIFHEALEKTLGRPVYTSEFGLNYKGLLQELNGEKEAPSLQEILEMIPKEKRMVLLITK